MASYGYFDNANREYVITNPELPQPWHNYIRNDEYAGLITHTGGGASFWKDPLRMRLLRYKFHLAPYDRPGRYVYVRDAETGKYWSATWAPVQTPPARTKFRCHVGMGYNRVVTRYDGIEAEMLYFVPPSDALEIWRLTLTNVGRRTRALRTFSYAELAVWGVIRDLINIDNASACARIAYEDGVFWHTTPNDVGGTIGTATWVFPVGYFTSNAAPVGHDGSRDHFLGVCRDESRPIVVEQGESTNVCADGLYPIASLSHDWRLRPGQSRTIIYQLGAAMSKAPLRRRMAKYRDEGKVAAEFARLAEYWESRLGVFQARTPDERFDTTVNTWCPYQVTNVTYTGKAVSPVNWGSGASMGFRDNGQWLMATVATDPKLARKNIEMLSHVQHTDGTVTKVFAPPVWDGESGFLDNQAWYPIFVNAYMKETGDLGLLDEEFPFVQGGKARLLDKMDLAMRVLWDRRGPRGLPATGHADWNDSLNPVPRESESVYNAEMFCAASRDMEEVYTRVGRPKDAARWARRRKRMAAAIDAGAWDGKWYTRMYLRDSGRVLGSSRTPKWGKIFIEPQVWAALCGSLPHERACTAMDSARKHLATPFGLKIVTPPCPQYDPEIGAVGVLNMGFKENGSVYSHCNAWAACAEAALGRGDLAFKTFMDFQPIMMNDNAEVREIEPYALSAQVQAEPFIKPGRGRNAWITGSIAWNWLAATQYILGVWPEYDGLRIDPCIPSSWKEYHVSRRFRGGRYDITVRNPRGVCGVVGELTVNGEKVPGNVAPLPARRGRKITVEAVLGEVQPARRDARQGE
jgi:cellobiose phosphorylase